MCGETTGIVREVNAPVDSLSAVLAGSVGTPSADSIVDWPFCGLFATNFAKADAQMFLREKHVRASVKARALIFLLVTTKRFIVRSPPVPPDCHMVRRCMFVCNLARQHWELLNRMIAHGQGEHLLFAPVRAIHYSVWQSACYSHHVAWCLNISGL